MNTYFAFKNYSIIFCHQSLKERSLVIAKWSEDNTWYRAKVLTISDDQAEVEFIDYGNTDRVNKNHIVQSTKDIPSDDSIDEFVLEDQENNDRGNSDPEKEEPVISAIPDKLVC